jgi:hypothetical protein
MPLNSRRGNKPIPDDLDKVLNDLQLLALQEAEELDWKLKFVRRPLYREAIPVITDPTGSKFGIIERNGEINLSPKTKIR